MATTPVYFRIPDDAHKALSKKAKQANMTLASYFRAAIVGDNSVVMANPPKQTLDKKKLIMLFSKASNNLNQLAHKAHRDELRGVISAKNYQLLLAEVSTIRSLLKQGIDNVD